MNTTPQNQDLGPQLGPDEARAALEQAARTQVVSRHDRLVYGGGTALFGVALGLLVPLSRVANPDGPSVVSAVYVVAVIAIAVWQTRAARSIPRGAKRIGYLGLAGSLVLSLATIMWLNWRERTEPTDPTQPWLLVVYGVVIALPMLVAGWVTYRRRG